MVPGKPTTLSGRKRLSSSRNIRAGSSSTPVKKFTSVSSSSSSSVHQTTKQLSSPKSSQQALEQESNINVYVRCRSRNDREIKENSGVVVSTLGKNGKEVILQTNQNSSINKTYTFDNVFGAESDQEALFEDVAKNVLHEMLQGYNCTIFAYGQTGTGKTYTMSGDITTSANGVLGVDAGIIPRTLVQLFKNLENDHPEYTVRVSFIELYNEELKDLLVPEYCERKVRIYDDHEKKSIVVQGMEEVFIKNAAEGLKLLGDGSYKRQVAATQCNDLSSRSHTVFTITVHMKKIDPISGEEYLKVGKLNLVDLAGSENINRSGAENKRAREAGMINQSLLTLGRVINCLVDKSSHIPYRESKLTRLLQDSLGGQTKTCIIATISPAKVSIEETMSTLEYANRAKNIKNKPAVNQSMSKQMLIGEYIQEIERLRKDLVATREQSGGVYMTTENHQQLVDESESRKILVAEQKMRIELLEDQNQRFKETYEQQLEECKEAKLQVNDLQKQLKESNEALHQMEQKANEFENKYEDEVILREELERTEQQSQALYKSLVHVVNDVYQTKSNLEHIMEQNIEISKQNQNFLNDNKTKISTFIDENLNQSLELLQSQHAHLIEQLNSEFEDAINKQKTALLGEIQDIETFKNSFDESTTMAISQINSSIMNMTDEMQKSFNRVIKAQSSLFVDKLPEFRDQLLKNAQIHESLISNTETTVQDSYHAIGKKFQTTFELIETQLAAQIEELKRLCVVIQEYGERSSKLLESQISANEIVHKKEIEDQQHEQNELIQKIVGLIKNSTSQRQTRMTDSFMTGQESLSTISNSHVNFIEAQASSLNNLAKSETIFADAIIYEKSHLKDDLVQSHNSSQNAVIALNDNLKKFSQSQNGALENMIKEVHEDNKKTKMEQETILAYGDTQLGEIKETLKCLGTNTAKSFDGISLNLHNYKDTLGDIKPSVIDNYTTRQNEVLYKYRDSALDSNKQIKDHINVLEYVEPNSTIPISKKYEYPNSLPPSKRREDLLQFKKRKIQVARDNDMMNESMVLNEMENLTPLPVPVPDRPMIENTPSSMMKVKQIKDLHRVRPTTGSNKTTKSKILQELNI